MRTHSWHCFYSLPQPNRSLNVWTLWLHLCVKHSQPSNKCGLSTQNNRKWEGCFITFPCLAQTRKGYSGLSLTGSIKNLRRNKVTASLPDQLAWCLRHFRQLSTEGPNMWVLIWTEPKPLEFYTSLPKISLHAATCSSPRHCLLGVRVTLTYTCSAKYSWESNGSHEVLLPTLSVILKFLLHGLCNDQVLNASPLECFIVGWS